MRLIIKALIYVSITASVLWAFYKMPEDGDILSVNYPNVRRVYLLPRKEGC